MNVWISIVFFFYTLPVSDVSSYSATSYCVMAKDDYMVLSSNNEDHTQSVASISKVMSAIVALEHSDLQDEITVDEIVLQAYGSSAYLQIGETYTMEDLLHALMLRSGNDAALVIAQHVGGDVETFVEMMNDKAKTLGMNNTTFANPSGLDEEDGGNISTSCEMALLTAYAMQNEDFASISATKTYYPKEGILYTNKNRFLTQYEYATGGKTGYTKLAKRTLITTSDKEDLEVIVVTLNCGDDFAYHEYLHEQAHNTYQNELVIKAGTYLIEQKEYTLENVYATLPKENPSIEMKSIVDDSLQITLTYNNQTRGYEYE